MNCLEKLFVKAIDEMQGRKEPLRCKHSLT